MERRSQGDLPSLSTRDIRRKLEGRFEVLESTREIYSALSRLLAKRNWLLHLNAHLTPLREALHLESLLDEALLHLHRRARQEGWPATLPAMALVREVETLRERLTKLARRSLCETGETRLAELLGRLERLALTTLASPLLPDEEPIHTGGFELHGLHIFLLWLGALFVPTITESGGLVCLGIAVLWTSSQYMSSGRYQVTRTRLLWKPTRGSPIQVPLRAIDPQGVRLLFGKTVRIRLSDGPTLELRHIGIPGFLADILHHLASGPTPPVKVRPPRRWPQLPWHLRSTLGLEPTHFMNIRPPRRWYQLFL